MKTRDNLKYFVNNFKRSFLGTKKLWVKVAIFGYFWSFQVVEMGFG